MESPSAAAALTAPLLSPPSNATELSDVPAQDSTRTTTSAAREELCLDGGSIGIDSDEERSQQQRAADELHDSSHASGTADALRCSSSDSGSSTSGAVTTRTTRTKTTTTTTTSKTTVSSLSSGSLSAVNNFSISNTVETMRTVDQIRHRLKRPSTASTLTSSNDSSRHGSVVATALNPRPSVSGFLRMRQSAREWRMKTWYCVLYNAHLYWYASKKDAQVAKRLQGQVCVMSACVSAGAGKMHIYPNAFVFTAKSGQVYFCSAPTPEDQQQWIESMNASAAPHQPQQQLSDVSTHVASSDSTSSGSQSSLVALESLAEERAAHPVLLHHGAADSLSFRRARTTGRLELNAKAPSDLACFSCDLEFGALRRRRHVCSNCGHGFCRWHCSQYVLLEGGASRSGGKGSDSSGAASVGTRVARVCDACAQRQHFITFAVALTSNMVTRMANTSDSAAAFALLCPHDCFRRERESKRRDSSSDCTASYDAEPRCHRRQWRELQLVIAKPASFTALNLMCFLKKYERMPWLFARTLCLFIPLFETDAAALSEYWVQFVGMFVPLIQSVYPEQEYYHATLPSGSVTDEYVHVTSDEQLSSLCLYMDVTLAICRRSSTLALRTVWECLALYEDAQQQGSRVCANYILLLIYLVSAFDGDSELVANIWLRNAPDAQADAMVAAMDDYLRVADALSKRAPRSLALQWIHATHARDQQRWTQRIKRLMRSFASDEKLPSLRILKLFSPVAAESEALYETAIGASSDDDDDGDDGGDNSDSVERNLRLSLQSGSSASHRERQFNAEANFVHNLTEIAEHLRHIPSVAARPRTLPALLRRLQQTLNSGVASLSNPQYLPLSNDYSSSSSASAPKILRVVLDEGKVFSTRCRAPTLIVFEALTSEMAEVALSVDDDTDDDDDDETDTDDPSPRGDAAAPVAVFTSAPANQRTLARQDSEMLDRLLCSFDKNAIASLINGENSPRDVNNTKPSSTVLSLSSELEEESHDDEDCENEPPPEEMAKEDARLVYEESTSACMLVESATRESGDQALNVSSGTHRSGETWAVKTQRIRAASEFGDLPGWTLVSVIAKSFDDLRQEVFALQLMTTLQAIFHGNNLRHLYLRPYRILCTGANAGLIETLTDSLSIDAVKKQHGSLWQYFVALFGDERSEAFCTARQAFVTSMAASSVFCYLFQIKDRHNGNIMIDREGHIMHIDFGFILGIMPGGAFSLEKDSPFKLTLEMVELMGGLESANYHTFRQLFLAGMLAVRREYVKLLSLIHLTAADSPFPCFQSQSPGVVLDAFRRRLFLEHSDATASSLILRLVDKSYNNWGVRQYDKFQRSTNGILP